MPSASCVLSFLPIKCEYSSVWVRRKLSLRDWRLASRASSSALAFSSCFFSARLRAASSSFSFFFQYTSISRMTFLALVAASLFILERCVLRLRCPNALRWHACAVRCVFCLTTLSYAWKTL